MRAFPVWSAREWNFRVTLDIYIVYGGMLASYAYIKATEYRLTDKPWFPSANSFSFRMPCDKRRLFKPAEMASLMSMNAGLSLYWYHILHHDRRSPVQRQTRIHAHQARHLGRLEQPSLRVSKNPIDLPQVRITHQNETSGAK
jgi:hypothetical protein